MHNKQSTIRNHWITTSSVGLGVSFGCALLFTQNLAQSILIMLATSPGVAASAIVSSRQRRLVLRKGRGKPRSTQLQQQNEILTEQLSQKKQHCQLIEARITQLHHLAANLTDRIDRDQERQQQLDQQISTAIAYYQEQENIAASLDRKIQAKQANLLEVETALNILKLELAQVQSIHAELIAVNSQANHSLQQVQHQVEKYQTTKQNLESQINQLQHQQIVKHGDFDHSFAQKQALLQELDLAISDRQQAQQDLVAEMARIDSVIAEKTLQLTVQVQQIATTTTQLEQAESALQWKQVELNQLIATISATQIPDQPEHSIDYAQSLLSDQLLQRELKTAQLELQSRQAELDNLEFKLQQQLESISETDLIDSFQTLEPQPPIVDREIKEIDKVICLDEWYDKFVNNPHLSVLKHIEKHGTITESEASKKLGNARSVRQFANRLEEYAQSLPFSIRVESSPKGNRYLKEDRN